MTHARHSIPILAAAFALVASSTTRGGSCPPPPSVHVSGTINTCDPKPLPRRAIVRGTVDLNDRSAFPRHATIIVTVRERDAWGRCAVVCSQRVAPRRGCLTAPFELQLSPGMCREGCTYEVDARLDGPGITSWSCRPVGLRHGWGRHGGEQRVALMLERNVRFRAEWSLRWSSR
ncbi:MAG: YbaY family lipoprotein [Phycisphaerales bacterium]|nr:YbaY family lipoprotein [Phycisphaerales bacterium]